MQSAKDRISKEQKQISKLNETLSATKAKMKYGSTNYLQVIIARQSLLNAELSLVSDRYEALNQYFLLYKSLGGGKE